MAKYQISLSDLQRQGGIVKLQRDGFNKEQIFKSMYKQTAGATTEQRQELVSKLFDREKPC
jgi:hypothetical protein